MRLPLILLAASLVFAGCVTVPEVEDAVSTESVLDPGAWDEIRALLADVPCEAEVGAETSANLLDIGQLQMEEGDIGEIDIRGNIALVSRHQLGGLYTVDLSDPRDMRVLGTLALDETAALDVKWIPGMDMAVIGSGGKLFLIDVADLAAPTLVGEADFPTQAHMVTPWTQDGRTFVYVASQTNNMPAFVYELLDGELAPVGTFGTLPGTPLESGPLGNHDITIYNDTLLGAPVLYMADGLAGWSAWSLTDPAAPARIGGTPNLEGGVGYTHTIRVGFFGDKRIVVTMMEVGQNTLKVHDATDLETPILLARWNADPTKPTMPQHNIQLLGDWLFMAHYTSGFYAFNLSEVVNGPPLLGTLAMAPAAHWAVESPEDGGALGFANTWDLSLNKGVLYASELTGRLSAVGFGCLSAGDEWATATA